MKKVGKRLALERTTLRTLTPSRLARVHGGMPIDWEWEPPPPPDPPPTGESGLTGAAHSQNIC
jgi:hypothetical protein